MGMIFYSLVAGELPYGGDQDRLEGALMRGSRPTIDPLWHKGFMKVGLSFTEFVFSGDVYCD